MSDPLLDLLRSRVAAQSGDATDPLTSNAVTSKYLSRLPKLDLNALQTSEAQSLAQASHSNLLAIQALSSRSVKTLISSSEHLSKLATSLPLIATYAKAIRNGVGKLDGQAVAFSEKYSRSADTPSEVLERRKRALLLSRNAERVGDMLELPTLLSSAVHSAAASVSNSASGSSTSALSTTTTYNAALDLQSHIKRLTALHPGLELVQEIGSEATQAMREMAASLIQTLKAPNLKLAGGMRTIGWLRRVAPELVSTTYTTSGSGDSALLGASEEEGSLGAIFLICRLANLLNTLDALEPLRDLADQETKSRKSGRNEATGHQTERYLKRFLELFREQSFGILSMFRSIFPAEEASTNDGDLGLDFNKMGLGSAKVSGSSQNKVDRLPSAVSTFPLHLVSHVLMPTLRDYLPNISDKSAKESLLTQVLYCAGSLGRLGGDFSILLADLYVTDGFHASVVEDDDTGILEWVEIMQKHRIQAARLESLAGSGNMRSKPREVVAS